MSYVVLARKWRPMSFDDLVGQDHVSRTLANAIANDRVAHAFLFTGVRGVGKTTSARILAKALNCMRPAGSVPAGTDPGPTASPCLQCDACKQIAEGADVDVREIDGASYNGVDEVRNLQDTLPYRPQRDRYKIIIVDEVHMLSQAAWNAFLKTLEEPPPHVKFIFATTEVHKVPITILSRVQRFDFKLIPTQLINSRLRHVLEKEGIESDDRAVSILAREAAGSMRDAMSLLDQVIAFGGAKLSGDDVARVLGVASHQVLHDIARALVAGDAGRCLKIVAQLANQGYNISTVTRDLLALLRDLVVAKVCKDPADLLDLADEERSDVQNLATEADADDLLRLHQGFSKAFDDVIKSAQPRASLEMLLVRLARRPPLLPVDDLIQRLLTLERRLGTPPRRGAPTGGGGGGTRPPSAQAPRRAREAKSSGSAPAPERPEEPPSAQPPPEASPQSPSPPPSAPRPIAPAQVPNEASVVPRRGAGPPPEQRAARPRSPMAPPAEPVQRPRSAPVSRRGSTAAAVVAAAAEPEPVLAVWTRVVHRVRATRPELAAVLNHAVPKEVSSDQVVVAYSQRSVFTNAAQHKETLEALEVAARQELGRAPRIHIELGEARGETVSEVEARRREAERRAAIDRARNHPLVLEAQRVLGARVKRVLPYE